MWNRAGLILIVGSTFLTTLVSATAAIAEDFGNRTPTADEVLMSLDPPKTRGIRPAGGTLTMPRAAMSMALKFDFNSSKISETEMDRLGIVAEALNRERLVGKKFEVIGHTDAKGSDAYNLKLSENRAQTVVNHLAKLGVDKNRLVVIGKGKSELKNPNDPEGAENRRVEIAVTR